MDILIVDLLVKVNISERQSPWCLYVCVSVYVYVCISFLLKAVLLTIADDFHLASLLPLCPIS